MKSISQHGQGAFGQIGRIAQTCGRAAWVAVLFVCWLPLNVGCHRVDQGKCSEGATQLVANDQPQAAIALISKCLKHRKADSVELISNRMIAFQQIGMAEEALGDLDWLMKRPEVPCIELLELQHLKTLILHFDLQKLDMALQSSILAVGLARECAQSQIVPLLLERGILNQLLGKCQLALDDLKAVIASGEKQHVRTAMRVAAQCDLALGNPEQAMYKIWAIMKPDSLQYLELLILARAHELSANKDSACRYYRFSAELGNLEADTAYFRCCVEK